MAAGQTYRNEVLNDSLWLVNEHKFLYNSDYFAWANWQPLGDLKDLRRRVSQKISSRRRM